MAFTTTTTLDEALNLYALSVSVKGFSNLKTTLRIYILPSFKFRGCSQVKIEDYPAKILLKDFVSDAQSFFDSAVDLALAQGKNVNTLKNNRSNLNKFLNWLQEQSWYSEVVTIREIPKCAPRIFAGVHLEEWRRGGRPYSANPYGLKEHELTPKVTQQLKQLHTYLTAEYMPARKGERAIRECTWLTYRYAILHFLGWLKNIIGFNPNDLDITLIADKSTLQEYITWHFDERGNGYNHVMQINRAALSVAKWQYGKMSKRAKFADCEQVLEIRAIQNELTSGLKNDRRTISPEALEEKLLKFEQCQEIVDYLRRCCSEKDSSNKKRPTHSIIDSWQNYLIIAILTYTPVRQREIRELQLNKNLIREPDGWWVKLTPEEHKTGSKSGKAREYPLFAGTAKEQLTKDLDDYVNKWRPQANLNHNYLFFMRGGESFPEKRGLPIPNQKHLTSIVPRVMLRTSALLYGKENAKHPSPHDFRRIFCTWLYTYGTLEEQELYAELMGHSVEQARRDYAMVKSRDKTERVGEAFRTVAERAKRIQAQKAQQDTA